MDLINIGRLVVTSLVQWCALKGFLFFKAKNVYKI